MARTTIGLKRVLAQLVAGFLLTGALVTAIPTPSPDDPSQTPDTFETSTEGQDGQVNNFAADFVAQLIANATQIDEDLQASARKRGQLKCKSAPSLVVNLGYARYQGTANTATGITSWKGIRYAAPPTGPLRWKPPQAPSIDRGLPIRAATDFGDICPQSLPAVPNAPFIPGNEDCLFLNVYAPSGATNLPVLVWIHGGGYGYGDGRQDMTEIINANNNGFVVVSIQYRLGAFGFLASQEVYDKGVVNAGILDQAFALAWIKAFICQFGGDPLSITISGESAGASSVMYHDLAVNGALGSLLFDQSIAASPYLPFQYKYNAAVPTAAYYALSAAVGCPSSGNVLSCLTSKDTATLQQANYGVTRQSTYGYWAFYPVTDNAYIMNLPSAQLGAKRVNGRKLLVGHNANEGPLFVPPTLTTESDLRGWLSLEFPNLSPAQLTSILAANPNSSPTDPTGPRFETNGVSGASAVNVSGDSNGQQQRGNNIYAEATFVCPSYWMATAYTGSSDEAYHYQYSVPFASHTTDIAAYFGPATPNIGANFAKAFRKVWGNFIVNGNPSIDAATAQNAAGIQWPQWQEGQEKQVNLNQTGGVPTQVVTQWGTTVTEFRDPGLRNAINIVNADAWEGGRGARCRFYKNLAPSIPA